MITPSIKCGRSPLATRISLARKPLVCSRTTVYDRAAAASYTMWPISEK
jgi:hypothetical protein